MQFKNWLTINEADRQMYFDFMKTPEVDYATAQKKGMFGPVYHGTTEENRNAINQKGFNLFVGGARTGNTRHGYDINDNGYSDRTGFPPPVHHLGFGIYFTTKKSIAKMYNDGTTKGLQQYYLDVPNLETINFGAPTTMMKWWMTNGYNIHKMQDKSEESRILATQNLTNNLKSQYDAVWFTGKSYFGTALDGDQICVYDAHRIYRYNPELNQTYAPGMRFVIKGTKDTGTMGNIRPIGTEAYEPFRAIGPSTYRLSVKFKPDVAQKLKAIYGNLLFQYIMKNPPSYMDSRMAHKKLTDLSDGVKDYVDYLFEPNTLQMNFPSVLVDRLLKKGERI